MFVFEVNTNVRQGDGSSPLLSNIVPENTLKITKETRLGINMGKTMNLLAYADDVVLFARKKQDLAILAETLINGDNKVVLCVNSEKTKIYGHW